MYKFHLGNCLWLPIEKQNFGVKMATSEKFQLTYNSKPLKKQVILLALQLQPNPGTYPIVQI